MGIVAKSHLISAVLGGLIVGGALAAFGIPGQSRTETIVEEAPVSAPQSSADPATSLTPHAIYQRDAPAVVFVRAKLVAPVAAPFIAPNGGSSDTSTGSGFLVDRQGDILTAFHIIDGADRSNGVTVQFQGDTVRPAAVAAVDPADDLAVLRVGLKGLPAVKPLPLGDSSAVRVGDPTLAIANPFGVDRTLSSGIVSALQNEIETASGQTVNNVIQTDDDPGVGGSGGPLLDAGGQVVGVDSELATGAGRVSFAVPSDTADSVLARVDHRALHLAYIGISSKPGTARAPGAAVGAVDRGGPAALAGLRPGDVVQKVDAVPVGSIGALLAVVSTHSPGQTVSLQVRRGHERRTLTVVLGSRTVPAPGG